MKNLDRDDSQTVVGQIRSEAPLGMLYGNRS
jgi:hypothetical protein